LTKGKPTNLTLEEALARNDPSLLAELPQAELARFYWRFRGMQKAFERDTAFWQSTNDNLKVAYEKLDEQERELALAYNIIREDLAVARQVQMALLPKVFSDMDAELDVGVFHKQLTEVGGDYYDFFRLTGDRYAIGVFDISGHGVSAALIMAYLKAQFMQIMERLDTPQGIVDWVNKSSFNFLREVRRYATVNFVTFEPGSIRYVSGGGYGLLVRGDGTLHTFNKKNHFLGLRLKPYQEYLLPFDPGDVLALYTDGMVEAQNADGIDYSVRRLNDIVVRNAALPAQQIVDLCVADYERFRQQDSDDITLIVLRRRPE
jgi:sigma-B regulation protein RsbU (phosphoserine phosphatase)